MNSTGKKVDAKATKWELMYLAALDGCQDPYLYAQRREEVEQHGLQALQLACLDDACRVIVRGGYVDEPQLFERDVRWVCGLTPSQPLFSFVEICEALGFDSSRWRQRLVELAHRARAGRATHRAPTPRCVRPREPRIKAPRRKAA